MTVCMKIATGTMMLLATGACASFDAMPRPIFDVQTAVGIPPDYQMAAALERMDRTDNPVAKKELRNRTIALYLAAADARYREFRVGLSRNVKGANLGLGLSVLALTGAGSIAKGAANELSAAASGASGAQATMNKELYFEKTLPAIVSAMETNRLRQRANIMRRLRDDDVIQYPLEQAFADIGDYQLATNLDNAIQQITTAAGQREAVAVQEYENATDSCNPTEPVGKLWGRVSVFVGGLVSGAFAAGTAAAEKAEMLKDLASVVSLVSGDETVETPHATTLAEARTQANQIRLTTTGDYCSETALQGLIGKIEAKTERKLPDGN
jgi:hypothetical protein